MIITFGTFWYLFWYLLVPFWITVSKGYLAWSEDFDLVLVPFGTFFYMYGIYTRAPPRGRTENI